MTNFIDFRTAPGEPIAIAASLGYVALEMNHDRLEWTDRQRSLFREVFRPLVKDSIAPQYVDMFRHVYVSGKFSDKYGPTIAELLGILNEVNKAWLLDPKNLDTLMDLHNNAVGRELASKTQGNESAFVASIWTAWMEGRFNVIDTDRDGKHVLRDSSVDDLASPFDGDRLEYEFDPYGPSPEVAPGEDVGPYDV